MLIVLGFRCLRFCGLGFLLVGKTLHDPSYTRKPTSLGVRLVGYAGFCSSAKLAWPDNLYQFH